MQEIIGRVFQALFSKQKIAGFVVGSILTVVAVGFEVAPHEIKAIICKADGQ